MMRSLFSGVSGLRNHQTKLDVIGNNVSNINTVGFKRAVTTFSDALSQTTSSATRPNDDTGRGGKNPMQIGLGSNLSSISNIMTTGSAERTDNPTDLMISGDSFFIVSDVSGYYFTRAGAFKVDKAGNLLDSNGLRVCGWNVDNKGEVVQDKVSGLNLYDGTKSYVTPAVTTEIDFSGNLDPDHPINSTSIAIYDSIGNRYVVDVDITYDKTSKQWTVNLDNTAIVNADPNNVVELTFGTNTLSFTFDDDGTLLSQDPNTLQISTTVAFATNPAPYNATFAEQVVIDFSSLTEFHDDVTAAAVSNGNEAGTLKGFSIGGDGLITGDYTNGLTKTLGQIAVASFKNPAGLQKVGNNLYTTTANSGDFDGTGHAVGSDGGEFLSGNLEMSNVDIAYEFTQMITTQRGFQANSRIITTSDEMLQELVNLKR